MSTRKRHATEAAVSGIEQFNRASHLAATALQEATDEIMLLKAELEEAQLEIRMLRSENILVKNIITQLSSNISQFEKSQAMKKKPLTITIDDVETDTNLHESPRESQASEQIEQPPKTGGKIGFIKHLPRLPNPILLKLAARKEK